MEFISREDQEQREETLLSPDAALSAATDGRPHSSESDILRTEYQRDRDKILHSKAFRRLSHKTQVFIAPKGDHFRTRLTHTLEVAQIARTIARALGLNEDLTEAIALGHDLGHTPFGHAGEEVLRERIAHYRGIPADDPCVRDLFHHNRQSVRVVQVLEHDGEGLNLTAEVRDGIYCHTGDVKADTLEGRIVGKADRIAYVNHDIDDAIRAGLLTEADLPASTHEILGVSHSARIETLVLDTVRASSESDDIVLTPAVWEAMMELRQFLFENIYHSEAVMVEVRKAQRLLGVLFDFLMEHPDCIPEEIRRVSPDDTLRSVCDYLAGMTDRFAVDLYRSLFVPRSFA